jgi:hypothetical protein
MINFVVALQAEAKPLISHYFLKQISSKPFRVYSAGGGPAANFGGQDKGIHLIISGVRKENSAHAVSFLHDFSHHEADQAWINLGIAGHRDYEIGTGILAHKIIDSESKKSWYPAIVFKPPVVTDSILTVRSQESRYEGSWIYDMEASGFYEAASERSLVELVHCYKIISDNQHSPYRRVTARSVEQIVSDHLGQLDFIVTELRNLVLKLRSFEISPEELEPFLIRWHFTVTEQFQLRKFIRRLKTLAFDHTLSDEIKALPDARSVLAVLNRYCEQSKYSVIL